MVLTVGEWRRRGAAYLQREAAAALDGDVPLSVADALLQNLVAADPADYRNFFSENLSPDRAQTYQDRLARYREGEPLAYICGESYFFGLRLSVGSGVLIPRPDTETLVLAGLDCLKALVWRRFADRDPVVPPLFVVEPCTGSLAVSLALDLLYGEWRAEMAGKLACPALKILAGDLSAEALTYAARNLVACAGRDTDISLEQMDLLQTMEPRVDLPRASLVIANPPYIEQALVPNLSPGVSRYEPVLALDGGADGLDFYRRLAVEAKDCLHEGGYIAVEHGYNQGEAVARIFREAGDWSCGQVLKDLAGRDRVYTALYRQA